MRFALPLGAFLLLIIGLGVGLTLRPDEVPSPLIGKPAPEFAGPSLDNPDATVAREDLLGRVTVVNVWASWCAACLREHPYVTALADEVPVYGLNYKDGRADARAWLARNGDPYTASLHDPKGRVGLDWGVYGVPETYLLDDEGKIRYKRIGPIDEQVLNEELLPRIRHLRGGQG